MGKTFTEMNRRTLMKYFAAGTVIAPVASAVPTARLIEPPKIELVAAPLVVPPVDLNSLKSVRVTLTHLDGSQRTFESQRPVVHPPLEARRFLSDASFKSLEVYLESLSSPVGQALVMSIPDETLPNLQS